MRPPDRSTRPPTRDPRPATPRRAALALVLALALVGASTAVAEDLELPGLKGDKLREAELAQGAVIVVAWASWSPRCRDIVDRVNAISSAWSARARVVTVNFQEDAATVRKFLDEQKAEGKNLSAPVFLDTSGNFSKKHSVTFLPGLLIFRDGKTAFSGKLPADANPVISQAVQ